MKKDQEFNLENILDSIKSIDSRQTIAEISAQFFNALMLKERDIYLKEQLDNKANGFYERKIASTLGSLGLSIPRDRKSDFRPALMPDLWKRSDDSFQDVLFNLILQSYSPNKIKSFLTGLNLPYSNDQIEELRDELCSKAKELHSKELPDRAACIFIDAYHCDLKDDDSQKVRKAVIYSVIGITLDGYKDLFGYYILQGSETKEDWIAIFNDLISRGLKRIMLIISDDFSGLSDAVKTIFPGSDHQLCFVHLQRNVRKNMSKPDSKDFIYELSIIKKQKDFDSAIAAFFSLCDQYKSKYKSFIDYILSKKELYFSFLKYPEQIRKHIYTTNIVENFNSRIEIARVNSGGYFQSSKTADISMYVIFYRLKSNRWKKPIPSFRESLFDINQLFNLKFYKELR